MERSGCARIRAFRSWVSSKLGHGGKSTGNSAEGAEPQRQAIKSCLTQTGGQCVTLEAVFSQCGRQMRS